MDYSEHDGARRFPLGKRTFDLLGSLVAIVVFSPVWLLTALAVRFTSRGPVLFSSSRIGLRGAEFEMLKFRTMKTGTPQVATHLLDDPGQFLTPVGAFLRRASLDELPQLMNVVRGEMSLVGPRPALFNQHDLIQMRNDVGVDQLKPGVTGWAQVNGRDDLPIPEKVGFDAEYLENMSPSQDLRILIKSVLNVALGSGVNH